MFCWRRTCYQHCLLYWDLVRKFKKTSSLECLVLVTPKCLVVYSPCSGVHYYLELELVGNQKFHLLPHEEQSLHCRILMQCFRGLPKAAIRRRSSPRRYQSMTSLPLLLHGRDKFGLKSKLFKSSTYSAKRCESSLWYRGDYYFWCKHRCWCWCAYG